jgi:EAL domain-containing protein (putative c-di-GMP-specific phosphodiesterase class I)
MRCDYVQGFCFAPPLMGEVAELLIHKGRIAG